MSARLPNKLDGVTTSELIEQQESSSSGDGETQKGLQPKGHSEPNLGGDDSSSDAVANPAALDPSLRKRKASIAVVEMAYRDKDIGSSSGEHPTLRRWPTLDFHMAEINVLKPLSRREMQARVARRTKIVATLGPATFDRTAELMRAGVNVFRVNFSHCNTSNEEQMAMVLGVLKDIREGAEELGLADSVGVMADLCGPKVRCNGFPEGVEGMELVVGDTIKVATSEEPCGDGVMRTTVPGLVSELQRGHRVLMDDGALELVVTDRENDEVVVCQVRRGGLLKAHKGINVPDVAVAGITALTAKDRQDARWVVENAGDLVDMFALSFVQRGSDVVELREYLEELAGSSASTWGILSKIEKPQAIEALDDIIKESNALMVARGDLGVECELHKVPRLQKKIIEKANKAAIPVVTATQMLDSMIHNQVPTRAEVADVANAIMDGTDCVMLSGESSVGKWPIQTVATMVKIALDAEREHDRIRVPPSIVQEVTSFMRNSAAHVDPSAVTDRDRVHAVGTAAVLTAQSLAVKCLVVLPHPPQVKKCAALLSTVVQPRPDALVVAVEHHPHIARRHAFKWGVFPITIEAYKSPDEALVKIEAKMMDRQIVSDYDSVILASPFHPAFASLSHIIRVCQFGDATRADKARNRWKSAFNAVRSSEFMHAIKAAAEAEAADASASDASASDADPANADATADA